MGTWIDGKPLYQKTYISLHNVKDNVSIDISDIAPIVDYGHISLASLDFLFGTLRTYRNGSFYYGNGEQVVLYSFQPNASRIFINVSMTGSSEMGDFNYYITLQYTKTTD